MRWFAQRSTTRSRTITRTRLSLESLSDRIVPATATPTFTLNISDLTGLTPGDHAVYVAGFTNNEPRYLISGGNIYSRTGLGIKYSQFASFGSLDNYFDGRNARGSGLLFHRSEK